MKNRMTGKILLITLAGALTLNACDTSSNVDPLFQQHYIKYFGGDGDSEGVDLIVNPDDTYVLMGSEIRPDGARMIQVIKTDDEGNQIWSKYFGAGSEYPQDIEPIGTGYIILTNVAQGNGKFNFKLIRLTEDGDASDSVTYNILTDQQARTVTPLADGGFYVVGKTSDSDILNTNDNSLPVQEAEDLLFVRFDNTFSLAGTTEDRIGSSSIGSAVKVFENATGGFLYAAYSNQPTDGEPNVADSYELNFIFRSFSFDPGNVFTRYVGDDSKNEVMTQAFRSSDGSVYAIGTATDIASSNSTVLYTKIRNSVTVPSKQYENDFRPVGADNCEGVSIFANATTCLLLVNKISTDATRDVCLLKANAITGDIETSWTQGLTFGTPANDDMGNVVMLTPKGDILILATFNLTNQRKMTLIKLTENGGF